MAPSFSVKPQLVLSGNQSSQDISANVSVSTTHKDVEYTLKVTDAAVRDGLAKKGISVTAEKKKAFKVVYVIDDDAPTVTLHTSSDISDKTINLKYEHAAKSGKSAVEAEVAVDDKHTATVVYDTTAFTPNYKKATLKWKYAHSKDLTIEPSYNLGNDEITLSSTYAIDGDNKIKGTYTVKGDDLTLEYTNKNLIGGDLKATLTSKLSAFDAKGAKLKVTAERTFDL